MRIMRAARAYRRAVLIITVLINLCGSICANLINSNDKVYLGGINEDITENDTKESHRRNAPIIDEHYDKILRGDYKSYSYESEEIRDKPSCILGTADLYLAWWVFSNGTLNVPHTMRGRRALDLSFIPQTRYSVVKHIRNIASEYSADGISANESTIQMMSAAYTNLSRVPSEALEIISSTLQFLSLKGNNFSQSFIEGTIIGEDEIEPWDDFPYLPQLIELDLRNCRIYVLNINTFENLPGLQRLYMAHNQFGYMTAGTFGYVPHLVHLDMSHNEIGDLSGGSEPSNDPFSAMENGLYLPDDIFASMSELLFIDMSFTKIVTSSARAFSVLPSRLQLLSLCYTSLPILSPGMFNGTKLSVLDLSGNPTLAYNLQTNSLDGLANTLSILSVENSNIKSLEFFCRLKNLRILQLRKNNINQLSSSTFRGLDAMEMLDLSSNHLSNWYSRVFEHNPRLELLRLHDNNINLITTEMFRDFEQLKYLSIGNNDFICTCNLRSFMDVAVRNSRQVNCAVTEKTGPDIESIINDQLLSNFQTHPGGLLTAIEVENIIRTTYDIDGRIVHDNMLSIQHSYKNIVILKEKYLYYNVMVYQPPQVGRLASLNRKSGIRMIDGEVLDFQFQLIDFDENHYVCINSTTNDIYSLSQINDCEMDRFYEYDNLTPYTPTAWIWVLVVVAVMIGLYLLVWYKWRDIRFFCVSLHNVTILSSMRRKEKSSLLTKQETGDTTDEPYNYDVFVSYCDENRNWILDEFLPNIEQCRDINVCLHERDFQVGLSILENIIFCMDRSRCLLLVVSQSFLESQWCQFEMHLAQYRLLETRRDQLILILLEDVPKRKRSKTLHYLMKTKTYIKWPIAMETQNVKGLADERKLFWRRLKRALVGNEWESERITSSTNV